MMTSTQTTLARMLAAYDAWQPTGHDDEEPLDAIGDDLDNYGFLECEDYPDGVFVPNAAGRALIRQARAEGHIVDDWQAMARAAGWTPPASGGET